MEYGKIPFSQCAENYAADGVTAVELHQSVLESGAADATSVVKGQRLDDNAQGEMNMIENNLPLQISVLNVVETGRRNGGTKGARGCSVDGSSSKEPKQKRKREPIGDKPIPRAAKILTDRADRLINIVKSLAHRLIKQFERADPEIQESFSVVNQLFNPLLSEIKSIEEDIKKVLANVDEWRHLLAKERKRIDSVKKKTLEVEIYNKEV